MPRNQQEDTFDSVVESMESRRNSTKLNGVWFVDSEFLWEGRDRFDLGIEIFELCPDGRIELNR